MYEDLIARSEGRRTDGKEHTAALLSPKLLNRLLPAWMIVYKFRRIINDLVDYDPCQLSLNKSVLDRINQEAPRVAEWE